MVEVARERAINLLLLGKKHAYFIISLQAGGVVVF